MFTSRRTRHWDQNFFETFVQVKNEIYKDNLDYVSETLPDLQMFFGENSSFLKNKVFEACLFYDEQNKAVARLLWTFSEPQQLIFLGYFEISKDPRLQDFVCEQLHLEWQQFADKYKTDLQVHGPIQGSIFGSYRFREPTSNRYFLGEDQSQNFYIDVWKKWGFQVLETWHSFQYSTDKALKFYEAHRINRQQAWKDQSIQVRTLGERPWNEDVASIHRITCDAYGFFESPHYVDLEIFKKLCAKIKPLLKKDFIRILSVDGEDVAFTIALLDIQPLLRQFNADVQAGGVRKFLAKSLLLARFQFQKHPLMLLYTAKTKSCRLKWVLALLAGETIEAVKKYQPSSIITAFTSELTAANSSRPQDVERHSSHHLFFKKIESSSRP